ncbi:MAG: sel1 repeat family protein [Campylobacteraceae bacterium]|nr:sel1 repeat family protein [Campylobacteraceae bacterium]
MSKRFLMLIMIFLISVGICAETPKFESRKIADYQKECAAKEAQGCFFIGIAYFLGDGLDKDDKKSLEYLEKARELEPKNPNFLSTIAKMYYYDYKANEIKENLHKALDLFNRACRYGEFDSCNILGGIYEYGDGEIGSDYAIAALYYQKSCELKSLDGCDKLRNVKNRE